MTTAFITADGMLQIPEDVRKRTGLKAGIRVQIVEVPEGIRITPLNDMDRFRGLLPVRGKATNALLAERQKENADENHRLG